MARKNVMYVVFLNARRANLDWSLKATFASHIFFKVQVHFTRLEIESALQNKTSHVNVTFPRILCLN